MANFTRISLPPQYLSGAPSDLQVARPFVRGNGGTSPETLCPRLFEGMEQHDGVIFVWITLDPPTIIHFMYVW